MYPRCMENLAKLRELQMQTAIKERLILKTDIMIMNVNTVFADTKPI
jgi:hypothetical protein